MKTKLLVLFITVGCFSSVPVFANKTLSTPSVSEQKSDAQTSLNLSGAKAVVSNISQAQAPVESTGTVKENPVGQPINEPKGPSVHPIVPPSPAITPPEPTLWDKITSAYSAAVQRFTKPAASSSGNQQAVTPSPTIPSNNAQPAVVPSSPSNNTVTPSSSSITSPQVVAPSLPPVTQNNPAPTNNGFWSGLAAGAAATYAATTHQVQSYFQPTPAPQAPTSVAAVRDAVADYPSSKSSVEPVVPGSLQQQADASQAAAAASSPEDAAAKAGAGIDTGLPTTPSSGNLKDIVPLTPSSQQPANQPVAAGGEQPAEDQAPYPVSKPGIEETRGLPGIGLNDNTGNGGTEPYGIPGLPGINTNGPGQGSSIKAPDVAPSQAEVDAAINQPAPAAGGEQPAGTPPVPAAGEQQAEEQAPYPVSKPGIEETRGLPGIGLNDNTGNGGTEPYGIPGLPGINTNGPGQGSSIKAPDVAPSQAEVDAAINQPAPAVGQQQAGEQQPAPVEAPPAPSLDLSHAQAVVDAVREPDAPVESPGTIKESPVGQPVSDYKPSGPSVNPVEPPSPETTPSVTQQPAETPPPAPAVEQPAETPPPTPAVEQPAETPPAPAVEQPAQTPQPVASSGGQQAESPPSS